MPTSWIYHLKKPGLVKEAEERGLTTADLTVEEIRKLLVEAELEAEGRGVSKEGLGGESAANPTQERKPRTGSSRKDQSKQVNRPENEQVEKMENTEDKNKVKTLSKLIKEWNLTFRTTDNAVEFVERFEELIAASGISREEILPALPRILQGKALLWYRNNEKSWQTWEQFLGLFKLYYFPGNYEEDLIVRIVARKQRYGETFTNYITDLQTLMRRYDKLTDGEQLYRIHENMLKQYKLYIKKQDYDDLTGLLKLAAEYERISTTTYNDTRYEGTPNEKPRADQQRRWDDQQPDPQPTGEGTATRKFQTHEERNTPTRWRGENVSTAEVEGVISTLVGLKDAVVYGVSSPEVEGKAGMAAIANPEKKLDIPYLTKGLRSSLPAYARPLFLRVLPEPPLTATFKLRKKDLVEQGYTLGLHEDPMYFMDQKSGEYVPLTRKLYDDIVKGVVRL